MGGTWGPKLALICDIFKTFTFCGGHCAVVLCASGPQTILFCTRGCPLVDAILRLGPTPKILTPGAPGPPTPKKVFPQFPKIFRGQGRNFDCVIWGPPRVVSDEILVTVPQPTAPQKNSKVLTNIVDFSSYTNFRPSKKIEWMRPGAPYDDAKNLPNRLTPRDFLAKKPKSP